jgi:hypothetical protein
MPAKNPRVNTVLPPALYATVAKLAHREGVSLSRKVGDLVREALELEEDIGLDLVVRRREKQGATGRWISHDEAKRRLGL